jgi:hypothetical protein
MDKPLFHAEVVNLSYRRETLLVDVMPNLQEGQRRAVVDLRLDTDDEHMLGNWPVGTMCPDNAQALARFLWDAAGIAALLDEEPRAGITGVRVLPTITLCGTKFIIDERLRQLRNVENPAHFFDLEDRVWQ